MADVPHMRRYCLRVLGLTDGVKTGQQTLTRDVINMERVGRATRKVDRPILEGDGELLTRMLLGKVPQLFDDLGVNLSQ